MARRFESAGIRDQSLYRRSGDGADAGDRRQAAHVFVALCLRNDGTFEFVDLISQAVDLIGNRHQGEACRCGQSSIFTVPHDGHQRRNAGKAAGRDDAQFGTE